jgi:hypothetical protein
LSRWDACRGSRAEARPSPKKPTPARFWSPGFRRWDACRGGRAEARPSPKKPTPARFWSPGFRQWDACRGSRVLPGKTDPAEAGTPERRYLDETFKFHKPGLRSSDVRINISRFVKCLGAHPFRTSSQFRIAIVTAFTRQAAMPPPACATVIVACKCGQPARREKEWNLSGNGTYT